jgi:amino acid transporter
MFAALFSSILGIFSNYGSAEKYGHAVTMAEYEKEIRHHKNVSKAFSVAEIAVPIIVVLIVIFLFVKYKDKI